MAGGEDVRLARQLQEAGGHRERPAMMHEAFCILACIIVCLRELLKGLFNTYAEGKKTSYLHAGTSHMSTPLSDVCQEKECLEG